MTYQIADKAIAMLNRKMIQRFNRTKRTLLKIDELNTLQAAESLYTNLDKDNRKAFLELAQAQYMRVKPHGKKKPDEDWIEDYLFGYSPICKYVYAHEVERKKAYFAESLVASGNAADYRRAMSYWSRMTAQYCDEISDAAAIKAYKDAGVKQVMWLSRCDNHVCNDCRERHGKIYSIDNIPPKTHWGCRCTLKPITGAKP